MKTINRQKCYWRFSTSDFVLRFKAAFVATVLTMTSGASMGEDIEIYTGVIANSSGDGTTIADNPDFFPNVLFILDNSTSMGETEPVLDRVLTRDLTSANPTEGCDIDLANYNPDIDYSFGANSNDQNAYIYRNSSFTGRVVSLAQNQCRAFRNVVANNRNRPILNSQLIQWGFLRRERGGATYSWDGNLNNFDNNNGSAVECAADQGNHGHNTRNTRDRNARNPTNGTRFRNDPGQFYFGNRNFGRNPYNGVSSSEWVSGNYHRYLEVARNPSSLPSNCPEAEAAGTPIGDLDSSQPLGTVLNPLITTLDPVADRSAFCSDAGRNFATGRTSSKNLYFQVPGANSDQVFVYRCQTRLNIMQDALTNVLASQTSINAGLMRFNLNAGGLPGGGTVVSAIAPMNDDANRQSLINEINNIEFGQATPLSEALYESYRYLNGQTIDQGRTTPGSAGTTHATFDVDFRTPVNRTRTAFQTDQRARTTSGGNRYRSPMAQQCQPTNVVLLSDGAPTNDQERNAKIREVTGSSCSGQGGCADDIAAYMQNNDIAPSASVNRNVNTYTIGLNAGQGLIDYLSNVARSGQPPSSDPNPGFFTADNVSGLESAFRSILGDVQSEEADVFSAPAVTVNSFNRLQNRDDLYYALFRPENGPRWAGNLKRYRVDGNSESIVDVTGSDAIDESSGFFAEDSRSFWSDQEDGPIVDQGGAGGRLRFERRLYGNVNGRDVSLSVASNSSDGIDNPAVKKFLDETVNLDSNPVNIGAVGATDDLIEENQKRVAAWTLGLDIESPADASGGFENNNYIGDSLHGTPYVLSFGVTIRDPKDVIFFTSNQGLLHAIDGDTGDELWSYVVDSSLFSNLGEFYNNQGFDKVYGLDAEMAFNVKRTSVEVESAQLYFGQRRGGRKVFSVDVTNARKGGTDSPVSRRWVINGGVADFARMGQTWAEPVVANVNYCDKEDGCGDAIEGRSVVFISGGYDEFYDNEFNDIQSVRDGDVLGNALYMVDAATGELLWMAGSDVIKSNRDLKIPEMVHSIVAKPAVIDSNGNGLADTIFITDVAGQLFRIDFNTSVFDTGDDISSRNNFETKNGSGVNGNAVLIDSVSGGQIANIGERSVNRRFYNALNVALLPGGEDDESDDGTTEVRYVIVTGSGYRAHPLDSEAFGNKLFVIFDEYVNLPLNDRNAQPIYTYQSIPEINFDIRTFDFSSLDIIEIDDLKELEIEGGLTDSDTAALRGGAIPGKTGFSVSLPRGAEKILNAGLIADSAILFTTYTPSNNNASNLAETCEAGLGQSSFYALDLTPRGELRAAEVLDNPGIAPTPVLVYLIRDNPDGREIEPVIIVGTEPIKNRIDPNRVERVEDDDDDDDDDDDCEKILCPANIGKAIKAVWSEENRAQ